MWLDVLKMCQDVLEVRWTYSRCAGRIHGALDIFKVHWTYSRCARTDLRCGQMFRGVLVQVWGVQRRVLVNCSTGIAGEWGVSLALQTHGRGFRGCIQGSIQNPRTQPHFVKDHSKAEMQRSSCLGLGDCLESANGECIESREVIGSRGRCLGWCI